MMSGEGKDARIRRRFMMLDRGQELLKAKSVNDLLKAVYDVLEGKRDHEMFNDWSTDNMRSGSCDGYGAEGPAP